MLQIQKPELEPKATVVPMPLRKALCGYGSTKISKQTLHKLLGETVTHILKTKKLDYTLHCSRTFSTFAMGGGTICEAHLPEELHWSAKANLIKSGILMQLGIGEPDSSAMSDDGLFSLNVDAESTENLGVTMAHKQIEDDISGTVSVPWLKDAAKFYDAVRSTNESSRYVFIAVETNGKGKLAMRLRGTKCSVRVEPFNASLSEDMDMIGLNNNGDYASGHFEMHGTLPLKRYFAMMKASLTGWEVAKFDEEKIRKLSV